MRAIEETDTSRCEIFSATELIFLYFRQAVFKTDPPNTLEN